MLALLVRELESGISSWDTSSCQPLLWKWGEFEEGGSPMEQKWVGELQRPGVSLGAIVEIMATMLGSPFQLAQGL